MKHIDLTNEIKIIIRGMEKKNFRRKICWTI